MNDGMVEPGQAPQHWGFTKENFEEGSYLWITGKKCTISFIESRNKGRGAFSSLIKSIEADGYQVEVPTPLGFMQQILTRWGFKPSREWAPELNEDVEVWTR
jgi:hypothetical protein